MARVSTYLNFQGQAEEAFAFYGQVFGTVPEGLMRLSDLPEGARPPLSPEELNLVMHVELKIWAGHYIMATDMIESLGQKLVVGNNTTLNLELDSRDDADRLYGLLSDGGADGSGMLDEFWGYWGSCLDRFGVRWMFNVMSTSSTEA